MEGKNSVCLMVGLLNKQPGVPPCQSKVRSQINVYNTEVIPRWRSRFAGKSVWGVQPDPLV
jgi:hypothetical protein